MKLTYEWNETVEQIRSATSINKTDIENVLNCILNMGFVPVQKEREAIINHMKEHQKWVKEEGRMTKDEGDAISEALNAMISFCEFRNGR